MDTIYDNSCTSGDAPAPDQSRSVLLAMSWYDHRVHLGISKYAKSRGWRVDARMANSTELALDWQGDGVITKLGCSSLDTELRDFVLGLGCPAIDLSVFGPEQGLPAIEFDPVQIGARAALHFVERGFRQFAWFPDLDLPPIRLRRAGFDTAVEKEGFELISIARSDDAAHADGWTATEQELAERLAALPRPIGVLCFNDEWGSRIVRACERAELRVPEDIAVLGIDNNELVCEHLPVPLSSVALDLETWGAEAARRLGALMDQRDTNSNPLRTESGTTPPLDLIAPGAVVTRQSTDVVAVSHPDVADAVEYILEHFHLGIGVSHVVEQSRLSGSGIKQAFRTHLRRSISDEIHRVRYEAVRRALLSTDLTLDRIAEDVGLGDVRNLHRLFARYESKSPAEFRRFEKGQRQQAG